MVKLSVFIVLLSVLLVPNTGLAQLPSDALCCSNVTCKCVATLPVTACQAVALSPFYTVAATKGPATDNVDCMCTTYFALDECTYLTFVVTTYSDGSTQIAQFFSSQFPNQKGAIRLEGNTGQAGGKTIVYNELYWAEPCDKVFISYICYLFGGCAMLQAQQQSGDQLSAVSSSPYISPFCFWRIKNLRRPQFSNTEWVQYPYNLNASCVATFNGASCVNVDKIPPGNQLSVPRPADAAIQAALARPFLVINPALQAIYNLLGPDATMDEVNAAVADINSTIAQMMPNMMAAAS